MVLSFWSGRNLDGIHFAMDFLGAWQKRQMGNDNVFLDAKDKDIIIIGGGDTGVDCIGTSLRMVSYPQKFSTELVSSSSRFAMCAHQNVDFHWDCF